MRKLFMTVLRGEDLSCEKIIITTVKTKHTLTYLNTILLWDS